MARDFKNLYREDVDFSILAQQDAEFKKYLKSNGQLDFSDPAAIQQLTKSLLRRDFDLEIELPGDRLCPPVPNRLRFILWVQDLLDSTSPRLNDSPDPERAVTALDVGAGASCIFPLLACRTRPRWRLVATDIDKKNLEHARANASRNGLETRVRPIATAPEGPLIPLDDIGLDRVDVVFTNPPFYGSATALADSAKLKSRPPFSACTGAEVEMVTAGGEVGFVRRLAVESKELGPARVGWSATMLGQRTSMAEIVEILKGMGCHNWAVSELVQGKRTRRWAVAWSWGAVRPSVAVARFMPSLPKHLLPFPSVFHFPLSDGKAAGPAAVSAQINAAMEGLDMQWRYKADRKEGVGFAVSNVWSRAARRKREGKSHGGSKRRGDGEEMDEDEVNDEEEDPALAIRIRVQESASSQSEDGDASEGKAAGWEVEVRWLVGMDSVLFESFCGWLKRIGGK